MITDTTGFILNLITLGFGICACLSVLMILTSIIYHCYYHRVKQEDKVTIIHWINICLVLLMLTVTIVSFNIQTFLGDVYEQDFNSARCVITGYFVAVFLNALYWGFVNQAFFRLCRIVYSTYRWLQFSWLYIIIFPIEMVFIYILLCAALIWHDIVYIPKEYYCFIDYTNMRIVIWLMFNAYGIPLLLLSLIYLRIVIYLRRQSNNQIVIVKQRQQRDLLVIRRILIIIGLLVALGLPTIVLLLIFYISGQLHPRFYRIVWFFINFSMIVLTISMIVLTPQLKKIVLKISHRNQVEPIGGSLVGTIPPRYIATIL